EGPTTEADSEGPAIDPETAALDAREQRLRWIYAAVGLSAVLSFASFHPLDVGALAYVALVPLLFVAAREKPLVGIAMAYVATVLYHVPGLAWIATTAPPGWLTTAFMEGGYGVALIGLPLWARRKGGLPLFVSLPLLGAALEVIRGNFPFIAFPWLFWGHTQHAFLTLAQIADVTSVYGLTAFVLLVNGALADTALLLWARNEAREELSLADRRRLGLTLGVPVMVGLALLGYGALRLSAVRRAMDSAGPGPRLMVIQADVPQSLKDGIGMSAVELASENLRLSAAALKWNPGREPIDAMLWSETMWPWPLEDRRPEAGHGVGYDAWFERYRRAVTRARLIAYQKVRGELYSLPKRMNAPLLVGAVDWGLGGGEPHNSYYQLALNGKRYGEVVARYDKIELVPVSEYIPFKRKDSPLHWFHKIMKGFVPPGFEVFARGEGPVLMEAGKFKLAPNICFEISFPELLRRSTLAGADVHVCPANDAWFVRGRRGEVATPTAEIPLALAHTRLRAIENRRSIVRCVNRGISLCMDPTGQIVDKIEVMDQNGVPHDVGVASYMAVRAPLTGLTSFYVRFGNVFAYACGLAALVLFVLTARGKVLFAPTEGVAASEGAPGS
ncbi:MAG TPA: apolipoprotein N-acyltransferase, partial [Planctomycetes bacterium]|nr:apolipoprotein N-acyltransferase [Planctomycetota bacterium]